MLQKISITCLQLLCSRRPPGYYCHCTANDQLVLFWPGKFVVAAFHQTSRHCEIKKKHICLHGISGQSTTSLVFSCLTNSFLGATKLSHLFIFHTPDFISKSYVLIKVTGPFCPGADSPHLHKHVDFTETLCSLDCRRVARFD